MVNEMGNTKSSQRANHADDVRGRNRTKQGDRKDVHEKVEGPKGGDPPAAVQTSDDKEQDDKKLKVSSQPAEVLPMESSDEASQGSIIQPAASPADNLEKEAEPNLEENLVVVKKEEEASNSTADTGSDLPVSSITDDRQETETKDEVTGFDNKSSEASSLETPSNNVEEAPQTKDESMALSKNKDKMDVSSNDEVNSSKSGLVMVGSESDSGNGKENGENTVLMETAPVMETVPTELPATEGTNEEEEEIKEKKVIEEIEKQELADAGISPNAAKEAEDHSGAVELRKSPSFGFDVSMEGKPGESNQTPLLHPNKNRTRNPSLFDGSKGVEDLTQTEAASAEEKTIEVAISDSDRSRATQQNVMKEEEGKGNVAVVAQKQDCETKGVEEPRPRPSPLKKFLCCAA